LSTRHAETIKRLTDILDGVSGLVAAENARMSLEDEVDQATAKAIAASESNGTSRPAGETAGSGAAGRPATPGPGGSVGSAGPRPAPPGSQAPARPAAPGQAGPGQPQQASSSTQPSAVQPQEKPSSPARAAVMDTGEKSEGARIMPGGDNSGRPPHSR
jgi:hypothetical protein